jgi:hypothetical protein
MSAETITEKMYDDDRRSILKLTKRARRILRAGFVATVASAVVASAPESEPKPIRDAGIAVETLVVAGVVINEAARKRKLASFVDKYSSDFDKPRKEKTPSWYTYDREQKKGVVNMRGNILPIMGGLDSLLIYSSAAQLDQEVLWKDNFNPVNSPGTNATLAIIYIGCLAAIDKTIGREQETVMQILDNHEIAYERASI